MQKTEQNMIDQINDLSAKGIKSKDIFAQLTIQGIKIRESTVRRLARGDTGNVSKSNSFEEPETNGLTNLC